MSRRSLRKCVDADRVVKAIQAAERASEEVVQVIDRLVNERHHTR